MRKLLARIRAWLAKRISQFGLNMLTAQECQEWSEEKKAQADKIRDELCKAGWHEFTYDRKECFRCGKLSDPKEM
jgi:hypothetical protein